MNKRKFQLTLKHRTILIWLSLACFIQNLVVNGVMNVVVSSLQKEFYLTSADTGIYISVYDIGSLVSSLIIPILGTRGSKPKWIAFGMFMLCIGCFVNVLPHFIRPKTNHNLLNDTLNDANNVVELCSNNNNTLTKSCGKNNSNNSINYFKYILYASSVIHGLSSSSLSTLAFSYIEDIAPSKLSAIYESIYYAIGALGMGVGFMLTSVFLNIHNDIDKNNNIPNWLTTNHPNWIGAWWLPFLVFGIISLLVALLLCLFPKKASNNPDNYSNDNNNNNNEYEKNEENIQLNDNCDNKCSTKNVYENNNTLSNAVQDIGSTLSLNKTKSGGAAANLYLESTKINNNESTVNEQKKFNKLFYILKISLNLLSNPIFLFIVIASAIEGLLQNSFLAFGSLFLEYQFRIASSTASFMLGALSIPPLIMGSLLSGYLIKKFQWKIRQCLLFLTIVLFFNAILYSGFLVSCKEPNLVKIKNENYDLINNSTSICKSECNCNENLYKPVCLKNDDDEYIFQSSCFAGCKTYNYETNTYLNCTYAECLINTTIKLNNSQCPLSNQCKYKLFISYATIFLVMFFTALIYVPYVKVTIGCVENPEMNTIALGIKQLAMMGIGSIPGPIIFGSFIDLTCKYWYTDCLNQKVCKLYSNRNFSLTFGTLGVGFKFICWLSVFISCISLKLRKRKSDNYIGDKKPDNK